MTALSVKTGASSREQPKYPCTLLLSLQPTQPGSKKPESGLTGQILGMATSLQTTIYDTLSALILPECSCSKEQLRGAAQLQRQRQRSSSSVLCTMDALLGSAHTLGWLHLLCTLESLPKVSPMPRLLMRHGKHSSTLSCAQYGVLTLHSHSPPQI